MTKQELLTKLATECATWEDAIHLAVDIEMGLGHSIGPLISKDDWLSERERLLNKPSWNDAPEGATHLALDGRNNSWNWFFGEPVRSEHWRLWGKNDGYVEHKFACFSFKKLAGYDWRDSLEERPA